MYRENNKGPGTVPWGTPDKTGLGSPRDAGQGDDV